MSTEQIPAEAVEAAARAMYPEEFENPRLYVDSCDTARCQARLALAAALPHLATHHPSRVLPIVEDVAEAACRGAHPTRWEHRSTASPCDHCRQGAPRVLALFAAAPTVQQVRAEALREAEALVRPRYRVEYAASSDVMTRAWGMQNGALHSAADRIARAAETEGE